MQQILALFVFLRTFFDDLLLLISTLNTLAQHTYLCAWIVPSDDIPDLVDVATLSVLHHRRNPPFLLLHHLGQTEAPLTSLLVFAFDFRWDRCSLFRRDF